MTQKAPYKGLRADSVEKHEPVSDINTTAADSLKVLDPKRPIREADIMTPINNTGMPTTRMMAVKPSAKFSVSNSKPVKKTSDNEI